MSIFHVAITAIIFFPNGILTNYAESHGKMRTSARKVLSESAEDDFDDTSIRRREPVEPLPHHSVCSMALRPEDRAFCSEKLSYRFTFDRKTQTCKMFTGCKPAKPGNNFQRMSGCTQVCRVKARQDLAGLRGHGANKGGVVNSWRAPEKLPPKTVCSLALRREDLICTGQKEPNARNRYYYEPSSKSCEIFVGCKPDVAGNNFQNLMACSKVCGANITALTRRKEVVLSPKDPPKKNGKNFKPKPPTGDKVEKASPSRGMHGSALIKNLRNKIDKIPKQQQKPAGNRFRDSNAVLSKYHFERPLKHV